MMLRINCNLHVITNDPGVLATCRHRARVRIGQRDLLEVAKFSEAVEVSSLLRFVSFDLSPARC
jgi:hypothetical protein